MFTSDNGARLLNHGHGQGGNNGQFKCGKGTTYEGGHRFRSFYQNVLFKKISNCRVPGIMSYPGKIQTGSSSALVSHLDIVPTVLGLLDIQTPLLDNIALDG